MPKCLLDGAWRMAHGSGLMAQGSWRMGQDPGDWPGLGPARLQIEGAGPALLGHEPGDLRCEP